MAIIWAKAEPARLNYAEILVDSLYEKMLHAIDDDEIFMPIALKTAKKKQELQ